MLRTLLRFLLASSLSILFTAAASAAVITWDAGAFPDTSWSNCVNWSTNTCPSSVDIATFGSSATGNAVITTSLSGASAPAGIDINTGYTGSIILNSGVSISVGNSHFDQADGTFNGGNSLIIVSGNFVLSGGTFNSTSANLSIAGGFTHTAGGTFANSSGTVTLLGSSSAVNVNVSETFYNLTIDSTGTKTISGSDTLIVQNTLTLTDGSVDQSIIPLAGTIAVNVSISHSTNFDGGTGQVNLESTGTVSFSSGSMTGFKLNGIGAVATGPTSGTLTFEGNLLIAAGTFNAGNGDIALSVNKTFVQSGGTFNGGAGSVTFPNAVTISSGTFNAGTTTNFTCDFCTFSLSGGSLVMVSGTLNVATHWTQTAGTFTEGTGTVVFLDGNGNKTIDVNGTETFYNLTIGDLSTDNETKSVSGSDTLTVTGVLDLRYGSLNQSIIPAAGSVIVNGSILHSVDFDGGTAQINLESTGTVSFSSGSMTGFKLNGAGAVATGPASGTLTFEGNLLIAAGTFNAGDGAITLSVALAFTQSGGVFNGGAGTITFPQTVTISGGTFNAGTLTNFACNTCTFTLSGGSLVMGSGTLNVATNWTQSAGTFTEGTGTVVFLEGNGGKNIDVSVTETFYNLTIGNGATSGWAKTVANNDALNVLNDLILVDGNLNQSTIPVSGTVTVGGDLTVQSGFDGATAKFIFNGTGDQNFDLTGVTGVLNGDIWVNKSAGEVLLLSALNMDASGQDLWIQEGILNLSGFNVSVTGPGTETFVVENGGHLKLQGGETITGDSPSYPQLDSGSTVTYTGNAGPYTLKDYTYHNLIINGAGATFSMGAGETLSGDLTVTAGTLDANDRTLSINGNATINGGTLKSGTNVITFGNAVGDAVSISSGGVLEIESDASALDIIKNAGTWTNTGGTIKYNSPTPTFGIVLSALSPYYNLEINSAGSTYELQGSTDVDMDLTITAGTLDVTVSGHGLSVGGDWTNLGGFTRRSGTVTFDTVASSAVISGNTTFHNLTCVTPNKNISFTNGTTQTIEGLLTLTGTAGNPILLRSTNDGVEWNLTVNGTSSVDYVDVQDSDAGAGNTITHAVSDTRSIDSGNNTNWGFNTAPVISGVSGVQGVEGDGRVTVEFTIDDFEDDDTLQVQVEYSIDGGASWEPATLSEVDGDTVASFDDPEVDNGELYQVGQLGAYLTSSSGANTVTTIWEAETDEPGTDIADAQVRVTPYDGALEGTTEESLGFILDMLAPAGLADFTYADASVDEIELTWTAATDSNFSHYEIWYGEDELGVETRDPAMSEWDNGDDVLLATASTESTTILGDYQENYFKIFAIDEYGNESTVADFYLEAFPEEEPEEADSGSVLFPPSGGTGTTLNPLYEYEIPDHWSVEYLQDLRDEDSLIEAAIESSDFLNLLEDFFSIPDVGFKRGEATEFLLGLKGYSLENLDFDETEISFLDVRQKHKRFDVIEFAHEQALIDGYPDGTFQPERVINRAEALKLIGKFLGVQVDDRLRGQELLEYYDLEANPFSDLDLEQWYAPYLVHAYKNKVVTGYENGTFGPANEVSHAEFLKMVLLYEGL